MRRFSYLVLLLLLSSNAATLLTACVTAPPPAQGRTGSFEVQSLLGSDWTVVALEGVATMTEPAPRLRWTQAGNVEGRGGCNSFVGRYYFEPGMLKVSALAATRMLCIPTPQGQEDKFFRALELTLSASLENGELLLMGADNSALMRLRQQETKR